MNDADTALAKLQSIQQLWVDLKQTRSNTPEHGRLMGKNRILSVEYQALIDPPNKP
jgi:hypothetical protein